MRNLISYDRRWLDGPHGGDHVGRAAWGLGEVIAANPGQALLGPSVRLLRELLPALAALRWPRSMAFAVLGLSRAGDERARRRTRPRPARPGGTRWPTLPREPDATTGTGPRTP